MKNLGEGTTTFIFGFIISIVCPFLFWIQNILLGMCLYEKSNCADAFRHVVSSLSVQLVVLYDVTLFNKKNNLGIYNSWSGMGRLLFGYTLYVLPLFGFGTLLMWGQLNVTLCRPLSATFLVDNEVVPILNMSSLYQSRQLFGQEQVTYEEGGEGKLLWDEGFGYRQHQYWPLDNITDLIKQYNYVGYHDVCIYLHRGVDVTTIANSDQLTTKGLNHLAHGYAVKNNSGADS